MRERQAMWLPVVGLCVGVIVGIFTSWTIPQDYARYTAVAAYLHERDGDDQTAARLYVEAAGKASNLAEREYLTRQAARLNRKCR